MQLRNACGTVVMRLRFGCGLGAVEERSWYSRGVLAVRVRFVNFSMGDTVYVIMSNRIDFYYK